MSRKEQVKQASESWGQKLVLKPPENNLSAVSEVVSISDFRATPGLCTNGNGGRGRGQVGVAVWAKPSSPASSTSGRATAFIYVTIWISKASFFEKAGI